MASDLKERFVRGLERAAGEAVERLGLAVSGGPDSLALLLLSHEIMPGRVGAATVDHGLRPEAADEAAFVASLCAERGIPHEILRPERPITGNLQSSARTARYALLAAWAARHGLSLIATAHHADDQLETLLMRLARGSGLAGLSGIRRRNGAIVRPLLDCTKAELANHCAAAGVTPADDPSNRDPAFDRVRMRAALADTPALLSPTAATRSADALAEAEAAMDWVVRREASLAIADDGRGGFLLGASDYPRELQRRLLEETLRRLGESPRGSVLSDALDRLRAGEQCSLGASLCTPRQNSWHIRPAPPRRCE